MTLPIPEYLKRAKIDTVELLFPWDDWHVQEAFMSKDDEHEELYDRLSALTPKMHLALTIACAEWIVHRFSRVSDDKLPWLYLESCWAALIDWRYAHTWDPPEAEWRGVVRGPLIVMQSIVRDTIIAVDEGASEDGPVWISNLAARVLPQLEEFLAWRETSIARLEQLNEFAQTDEEEDEDIFGDTDSSPPIPRELFDSDLPFDPESCFEFVNNFLKTLKTEENPFLRPSDEMEEIGFDGTPYQLLE